jgi:hypothetical protein
MAIPVEEKGDNSENLAWDLATRIPNENPV